LRPKEINPLKTLERVKGIEPSSSAWKAVALPLSYTRIRAQSPVLGDRAARLGDFLLSGGEVEVDFFAIVKPYVTVTAKTCL
jgi:hypothetical protein